MSGRSERIIGFTGITGFTGFTGFTGITGITGIIKRCVRDEGEPERSEGFA
jgi:hypothetical protein